MLRRVIASFEIPASTEAPPAIVYVPEGRHQINPLSQPDGIEFVVPPDLGPSLASQLDAQLQEMRKKNVIPWLDFEHTRKAPASGYPTRFWYQSGKGIMTDVDWSGSGRKAVEARDVRYFSPEVYLNDAGHPVELVARGPLGGLVAEPAFREIPPVAASDAGEPNEPHHSNQTMSHLILATCGLLTQSEAALPNAESLASQRVTSYRSNAEELTRVSASLATLTAERDGLQKRISEMEATVKAEREKRAETLVTAAVVDGRILGTDDTTKGFYKRLITAGDAEAETALANLTKREGSGLDKPLVTASAAGGNGNAVQGEHAFVTEARRLVTAGSYKTEGEAFGYLAASRPELYADYNKQFEIK